MTTDPSWTDSTRFPREDRRASPQHQSTVSLPLNQLLLMCSLSGFQLSRSAMRTGDARPQSRSCDPLKCAYMKSDKPCLTLSHDLFRHLLFLAKTEALHTANHSRNKSSPQALPRSAGLGLLLAQLRKVKLLSRAGRSSSTLPPNTLTDKSQQSWPCARWPLRSPETSPEKTRPPCSLRPPP